MIPGNDDDDEIQIEEICSLIKTSPDCDFEVIRELISKLANPERKFWNGESPIVCAVLKDRKDIVEVSKMAKPKSELLYCLCYANDVLSVNLKIFSSSRSSLTKLKEFY